MTEQQHLFQEVDADNADLIVFGLDELDYLRHNELARRYRAKCVCITENDIPTFAFPGLYAANEKSLLTAGRVETMSYFLSEREKGNPAVRRLVGQPMEKRYLYSFMGGSNSWPRKLIFRALKSKSDAVVEHTKSYDHWTDQPADIARKEAQRDRYARVMAESKFSLCPRGCGLSSYRLFESMSLGVAPVIIADGWRPVSGVDWSFALFVRESDIRNLEKIVRAHEPEWRERGEAASRAYQAHFATDKVAVMAYEHLKSVRKRYRSGA